MESRYLNHRAVLQCSHGGRVVLLPPPFRSLHVMQSPVVTDVDLMKAFIACPQAGPGIKPCTRILLIVVGRSLQIRVDNQIPILDSLQAITDGAPPGMVTVVNDGNSNASPAPY